MPNREIHKKGLKDDHHPTLSHIGVYVYRSGAFGDKPKPKDKE